MENEIEIVMKAIKNFTTKVSMDMEREGCIICYSYPGQCDWDRKNMLITDYCETCNMIICKECITRMERKCPICRITSHKYRKKALKIGEIKREIRSFRDLRELISENTLRNNLTVLEQQISEDLNTIERTPQENKRLRNARYRRRKRERQINV